MSSSSSSNRSDSANSSSSFFSQQWTRREKVLLVLLMVILVYYECDRGHSSIVTSGSSSIIKQPSTTNIKTAVNNNVTSTIIAHNNNLKRTPTQTTTGNKPYGNNDGNADAIRSHVDDAMQGGGSSGSSSSNGKLADNNTDDTSAAAATTTTMSTPGLINFAHIPKTAGTTIEIISKQNEHKCHLWGSRMVGNATLGKMYNWKSGYWFQKVEMPAIINGVNMTAQGTCGEWHIPPALLKPDLRAKLYPADDTFCILRQPLSRLISHYYYSYQGTGTRVINGTSGKVYTGGPCFNDTIEYTNFRLAGILREGLENPLGGMCHVTPQAAFLSQEVVDRAMANQTLSFSSRSLPPTASKQCNRILIMEYNLTGQFNKLMEDVECPIRMTPRVVNKQRGRCSDDPTMYTADNAHMQGKEFRKHLVSDLSDDIIELAQQLYKQDFQVYEYYANQVRAEQQKRRQLR